MSDKFVWKRGDIVISPVTEETWDLAYYSGDSHLLAMSINRLVQHFLQQDENAEIDWEIRSIVRSVKAKNMPSELRKELLIHGYLAVGVSGSPAVLTAAASIATPWKEKVASTIRVLWPDNYALAEPCHLELNFHLSPTMYAMTALHNLLKATIDGLGQVVFAASPGTKLTKWHTEDWWITTLAASKRITDGEPHLELKLTPGTQPYTGAAENHNVLVDVSITGSPPLFATNGNCSGGPFAGRLAAWR